MARRARPGSERARTADGVADAARARLHRAVADLPVPVAVGAAVGEGEQVEDQDAGAPDFKKMREAEQAHQIESTGKELRKLMAWVDTSQDTDYTEGSSAR